MKEIKERFEAYCAHCKETKKHITFEDPEEEEIDEETNKPFEILYSECLECGNIEFADY